MTKVLSLMKSDDDDDDHGKEGRNFRIPNTYTREEMFVLLPCSLVGQNAFILFLCIKLQVE